MATARRLKKAVVPMSPNITLAMLVCVAIMAALLIVDIARGQRMRGMLGFLFLLSIVVALHLTTDFPSLYSSHVAFGGTFPTLIAIGLMYVGVMLGMLGHYVWQMPGSFSWLDLLRPLVASPIILLPLIGSLDGSALQPMQLVSLTLLAFQNGFFWPRVLQDAKPKTI